MSIELIVVGSLNTASVEIGALYKGAILQGASCIIICHNHPLGKPEPSSTDATFTQEVKKAGDILRIPLVDHLVLGEDNTYYSFREEGKL